MTLVEGDNGVIVIDPLISAETAAAALALYRAHRGDRAVTAVIYTHAHGDHFGGVRGDAARTGSAHRAPGTGFLEPPSPRTSTPGRDEPAGRVHVRRPAGRRVPAGQIGAGLGKTTSLGSIGLIPPTLEITHTGQEERSTACSSSSR